MIASRLTALALFAGAALWLGSGYLLPHNGGDSRAAITASRSEEKPFRVAVLPTTNAPYSRKLLLSGRTEADRKVMLYARTGGELKELRVRRGDHVNKGDIIAVLSDDAREAQVAQARALLTQRKAELEARRKLIENGTMPRLDLVNLESQYKAAEAALAAAESERNRGVVTAPWAGVITDLPAEVGLAAFSFAGKEVAQLVALDPMLAVVEVSERKISGIKVGEPAEVRLVTGVTARGRVRYVSKTASQTTRTYRVEVEVPNPDGAIPDGITAEVTVPLATVLASRIPRSALTYSSAGDLGVRVVEGAGIVDFVPVQIVDDDLAHMWVAGVSDTARVIVQGQDFVREGQRVIAVTAPQAETAAR